MPFPVDIVPTRTALERLGLERQWFAVVPLVETERVKKITLGGNLIFVQTDYAMLHAFGAESGRLMWTAQLGERTGFARGVAANSFAVFVTNADVFSRTRNQDGRPIWKHDLGTIPTTTPVCDEDLALVGLTSGQLVALGLRHTDDKGNATILSRPVRRGK